MGIDREKSISKSRYFDNAYFTEEQWLSFLFQINAVRKCIAPPKKVLEIGKGGGYVAAILSEIGYQVTTFDVNEKLNPTHVVDISQKLQDCLLDDYDCVLCAEVLEHIPFDKFETCIKNIAKLSSSTVVLTIPDSLLRRDFLFRFFLKRYRELYFTYLTYKLRPLPSIHCWQLNSNSKCSYKKVRALIQEHLDIVEEGFVRRNTYHHYYICKINKNKQTSLSD